MRETLAGKSCNCVRSVFSNLHLALLYTLYALSYTNLLVMRLLGYSVLSRIYLKYSRLELQRASFSPLSSTTLLAQYSVYTTREHTSTTPTTLLLNSSAVWNAQSSNRFPSTFPQLSHNTATTLSLLLRSWSPLSSSPVVCVDHSHLPP